MPAVLHSAWASPHDSLAFVFTNISEQEQQFRWQADLSRYELAPAGVYRLSRLLRSGDRQPLAVLHDALLTRTEILSPYSALVLEVRPGNG